MDLKDLQRPKSGLVVVLPANRVQSERQLAQWGPFLPAPFGRRADSKNAGSNRFCGRRDSNADLHDLHDSHD